MMNYVWEIKLKRKETLEHQIFKRGEVEFRKRKSEELEGGRKKLEKISKGQLLKLILSLGKGFRTHLYQFEHKLHDFEKILAI